MDFVAFPLRIGAQGWLDRSPAPEDGLLRLFEAMIGTPQNGWRGSDSFGLRDALAAAQSKHGERLTLIKQMNRALLDLQIDWVTVQDVEFEPSGELGKMSYALTLFYKGKGVEVHRI